MSVRRDGPIRRASRHGPRCIRTFCLRRRLTMNTRLLATRIQTWIAAALVAVTAWPSPTRAQDDHMHAMTTPQRPLTPEEQKMANDLVAIVRSATVSFQTPDRL